MTSNNEINNVSLLIKLILDNRPWRLVPHLAGAMATATGTAAYAVITSSFWSIADALSPMRLLLINVIAIGMMTIWLLLRNNLWERPSKRGNKEKTYLYNASTLATLFIGVACMYIILYIATLIAALIFIDSNYLAKQLGQSSDFNLYAKIIWLASSVSIIAGALGSSFESEEAVRKATYSKRELKRQNTSTG